jgi:hypothetical protein
LKFNSYRQKAPAQYNSVTAYVFSDDGQLLASKDFTVNIDVPPPVKRDPIKPTPELAPTPTATTTPKTDKELQGPSRAQDDKTQEDVVSPQIPTADDTVKVPEIPPSEPSADQPSGSTPPESTPAPGVQKDSLPTTQQPEELPKPNTEGEPR